MLNENDDVLYFDLADAVTEIIQASIQKLRCSLNTIEELVHTAELKKAYEELKSAMDNILQIDLKKCAETEGLQEKLS